MKSDDELSLEDERAVDELLMKVCRGEYKSKKEESIQELKEPKEQNEQKVVIDVMGSVKKLGGDIKDEASQWKEKHGDKATAIGTEIAARVLATIINLVVFFFIVVVIVALVSALKGETSSYSTGTDTEYKIDRTQNCNADGWCDD